MKQPLFSIIIPSYNRQHTLKRTFESIQVQSFKNFEVIIVDDASTDDTIGFLETYQGLLPLRIYRNKQNLGIGPSRYHGYKKSEGKWILFLDSDDELYPEILAKLHQLVNDLDSDIMRVRGMVIKDDGSLSPRPNLVDEIWVYENYIRAINIQENEYNESSSIYKRDALETVPFPQNRSIETLFHLDFFKQYPVRTTPLIFRKYHDDSNNSTDDPKPIDLIQREACDNANMIDDVFFKHGEIIKEKAPNKYNNLVVFGIRNHSLCGNRKSAATYYFRNLDRASIKTFVYFFIGFLSPYLLARIINIHKSWNK